jgi:hypothetical protein
MNNEYLEAIMMAEGCSFFANGKEKNLLYVIGYFR